MRFSLALRKISLRFFAGVLAAIFVGLIITPNSSAQATTKQKSSCSPRVQGEAEVGRLAPTFTAKGLRFGCIESSQYLGKPAVINFWASWCFPCRKEFSLLKTAQKKYRKYGLSIVGISYKDIPSDARSFVKGKQADWSFASDSGGEIAMSYRVRAIPVTFFIDERGKLVSQVFGILSQRELNKEINKLIKSS